MKKHHRFALVGALVVLGASGLAPGVHAQGSAGGVANAEMLFQQAKADMAAKRYGDAVKKLEESYRLDPAGGTLQNLAVSYEEAGRVASAYARFQELKTKSKLSTPPRPDRVKLAEQHIAKLEPRLSRIRILVTAQGRAKDMEVKVDDTVYQEASWTSGILVDPGTHRVVVSAPGKKPRTLSVKVDDEGVIEEVKIPPLEDVPLEVATPVRQGPSLEEIERVSSQRALRTTGFVVGGIGLATLAGGAVFGVLTITTNSAAKSACQDNTGGSLSNKGSFDDPTKIADASGHCYGNTDASRKSADLTSSARTFANVANVLVPVGLLGLGVGTFLVLRSSLSSAAQARPAASSSSARASSVSARVVPSLGGVVVEGSF